MQVPREGCSANGKGQLMRYSWKALFGESRWRKMSHSNTEKWCSAREGKTRNESRKSRKPKGEKSEGKGEV